MGTIVDDKIPASSAKDIPLDYSATTTVRSIEDHSWIRYVPGPKPQHCFHGLPPSLSRLGVIVVGCFMLAISGTNISLMGSVSSVPSYLETVGLTDDSSHTQLLIGVLNSIYWIGVIVGAFFVGWLSDKVGRRRALVAFGIYGLCVVPLLAASQSFVWVLILRLLNGLFTGAFDSVGLNWAAETVHARRRGLAIASQMVCAACGAGVVYFLIYGLTRTPMGSVAWRLPLAWQLVYVLPSLVMVYFLPESPRWLVQVGFAREARDVLTIINKGVVDDDELQGAVDAQLESIQDTIDAEREHGASAGYWSMFTKRDELKTARRAWSALLIQFGTQAMVGSGVVSGYGITILETGGWDSNTAAMLSGVGIFTQAAFGIVGALLADRMGRRRALMYGALASLFNLSLMGMCGYFVNRYEESDPDRAKMYGTATLVMTLSFCAMFGMTYLWCPFVYPSEIFPARSRTRGSSVGIVGLASGSFLINMVSTYLFGSLGYAALFMFAGLSLLLGIICYLYMPETAGKSLEEVDGLYDTFRRTL